MQSFTPKHPLEQVSVGFDFSAELATGETITSSSIAVTVIKGVDPTPSNIKSGSAIVTGGQVAQLVVGGVAGSYYLLTGQVTTSYGQVLIDEGVLSIVESGKASALFIRAIDVYDLKSNQLALATATYGQLSLLSDDAVWAKLVAAENDLSRRLGIALAPMEIFSSQPTQAEINALSGGHYLVEPGYDLPPDFFAVGNFGFFQLRQRPVISIAEIKLIYPNQGGASFTIPPEWIRLDNKYGHVHLFPSAQSISAPLSLMTLQAIGSGMNIPHMIRVRYTAGLQSIDALYPDVVDLVKRMAVLRMLHDSFTPQNSSISADGLSQSNSADIAKMQGDIENQIESLKQSLLGPVMGFM